MKVGLTDKVEKHSEKLGRDAVFTLTSKITRLPRYLCIQVCVCVPEKWCISTHNN